MTNFTQLTSDAEEGRARARGGATSAMARRDRKDPTTVPGLPERRPYWYMTYWCQVCGDETRARHHTPKPSNPADRFRATYCDCLDSQFA